MACSNTVFLSLKGVGKCLLLPTAGTRHKISKSLMPSVLTFSPIYNLYVDPVTFLAGGCGF